MAAREEVRKERRAKRLYRAMPQKSRLHISVNGGKDVDHPALFVKRWQWHGNIPDDALAHRRHGSLLHDILEAHRLHEAKQPARKNGIARD